MVWGHDLYPSNRRMHYNKLRNIGRFAGLTVLVSVCALAYIAAFLLRFDGALTTSASEVLAGTLGWVLAVKVIGLGYARIHADVSRYVTFRDMVYLVRCVTLCTVGITLLDTMFLTSTVIPRSVILLDWGVTLAMVCSIRILPRLIHDTNWRWFSNQQGTVALIAGVNDAGEALLRSITRGKLQYRPIGFVDRHVHDVGRRIAGVPVLGTYDDIPRLVRERRVEEVLLTAGTLPGKEVRQLLTLAAEHGFRVKVLPSYEQILTGRVAINPRPVAIGDLLRRPSVDLDIGGIHQWIDHRTVMVTGSAGSIGSEICRQILQLAPHKVVLVDRSETGQFFLERELAKEFPDVELAVVLADLTDRDRMDAVLAEHQPQIVFHAAAYKHVPLMEAHVGEAVKNIVLSTRNLVDLAEEHGVDGLVMISTDKAVNPTSVMGSCKQLAEQYVQAKAATSHCRLVTVRFGNVLDSAGSVVPIFREQIANGGPVTVTHPEMVRYFMLIPEAAQLVIQAGAMGQGGEIFVLDMGDPVRIMDLAQDMIRLSGLRVGDDVEIEVTGLRPGEKLFEELYNDRELHQPTRHSKIMVATGQPPQMLQVLNDISHLSEIVNAPNEVVRTALQEIVPVEQPEPAERSIPLRRVA